jgi:hypothetical protein
VLCVDEHSFLIVTVIRYGLSTEVAVITSLGARRWWVLGALVVILLAVSLDLTALNVALPTLSTELHATTGALQWIVASYTLATLLIPAGLLGDRYGRKKVLLAADRRRTARGGPSPAAACGGARR